MYSAAVTLADDDTLEFAISVGQGCALTPQIFYEVVLQSYLFLGFPRMLLAAENLSRIFPLSHNGFRLERISSSEAQQWFEDGVELCKKVYGEKYESLMRKVGSMAPEVFRWMIIEGYGKVLSRPALDMVSRELSIIAFLMMENRKRQLHSHIEGALNIGASVELVQTVINDIGSASGDGHETALELLRGQGN
ncbi:MAG: carboxymuconolactone decarboxylase family protein [Candidatus Zixiibacteriota bacterium]|nr:MAG: carboxymuconolactone decarboxylase family protein [candidate division Zixibacteria bacterium]